MKVAYVDWVALNNSFMMFTMRLDEGLLMHKFDINSNLCDEVKAEFPHKGDIEG